MRSHPLQRLALIALAAGIAAGSHDEAVAETLVERGTYLVDAVMACDNCHTPRGPDGLDMARRFAGGSIVWDEPSFRVRGPNISSDPDAGLGAWTDAEIARALTHGAGRDGAPLAPIMPSAFYRVLTERDTAALVAFLRTVAPQPDVSDAPVYRGPMPEVIVPGGETAMDEAALDEPVARGFYLANLAHCMECHARDRQGRHDLVANLGEGGHEMAGPWGTALVPNITAHPEAGIGAWSDDEVIRALVEGVGRDGRRLAQPMARARYFSRMTEPDLRALVAYVRSLPPIE
jgi:mono/diheme cytochrome c family protein